MTGRKNKKTGENLSFRGELKTPPFRNLVFDIDFLHENRNHFLKKGNEVGGKKTAFCGRTAAHMTALMIFFL